MKKIVLLFSFFLLLSCSNSDDDVSSSSTDFNPPAWIQGTWALQDDTSNDAVVFNFTKADFCMTASYAKQCQKELVDQIKKNGGTVKVTETITANTYTVESYLVTVLSGLQVLERYLLSNKSLKKQSLKKIRDCF